MNTKLGKIKEVLKKSALKSWDFCRSNKGLILQVALITVAVPVMGECSEAGKVSISPLQEPLTLITETLTGPIPKAFTVISGAVAGIAWGAGWEQNIMQRAIKCVGGGAVATACGEGMDWIGIDDVSACLCS